MKVEGPLLAQVVDLVAIRDADLLDLSLLRTVRDVCSPEQISLLRLMPDTGLVLESLLMPDGSLDLAMEAEISPELHALLLQDEHDEPVVWKREDGRSAALYPVMEVRGIRTVVQLLDSAPPTPAEQAMLQGFAKFFRNYRMLLDDAQRDALTGLRNRKTFDGIVLSLLAPRATPVNAAAGDGRRAIDEAWLGIVDIDHFKRINDGFGHLYGDEVLLLLAQIMQRCFRAEDLLFRFGGEEFVIIVRGVERAEALQAFERFRVAVAEYQFPQVGKVTISGGVVQLTPGRMVSLMLDEADKALYWAKQNGRNRLVAYESLVERGDLSAAPSQTGSVDLF